jgi:hypothetical protein
LVWSLRNLLDAGDSYPKPLRDRAGDFVTAMLRGFC